MSETHQDVIEQLETRLQEVSDKKQERIQYGDDVGVAYRAGKEMALIYAIETIQDSGCNESE